MNGEEVPRQRSHGSGCLRCLQLDQLVSVPAAVRAGHRTGVVHGSVIGRFGYDVPFRGRVVQVSQLARALAAPKRPRAAVVPTIAVGGSSLLTLWNLQLAVLDPAAGSAWFGVLFFGGVSAANGWLLRARQRRLRLVGPLVGDAIRLWQHSWYCYRCGVVSVYGLSPSTVVAANGFASTLIAMVRERRHPPLTRSSSHAMS